MINNKKQSDNNNDKEQRQGLECSQCGCRHLPVLYTRKQTGYVQRVRECRHCGKRVVTREQI